MKILFIVASFLFSVSQGAVVQQVRGHVGEDLSIHCFRNWAFNASRGQYNMSLCQGPCSAESLLVERSASAARVREADRYRMESSRAGFRVTIKRLRRTDAGRYFCERDGHGTVQSQELIVTVSEVGTVPVESSPPTTTGPTLPQDNPLDTTWPSAGLTPQTTSDGSNKQAASILTDTTVVIIVSVSLALLVCAIIPLIFYGHWRSSGEIQISAGENKTEVGYSEEQTDIPLAHTSVALQTDGTDTGAQDAEQYASAYQALDPQALE